MVELALASEEKPKGWRFRLPPAVPPFNTRVHRIFSLFWIAAFLLAIVRAGGGDLPPLHRAQQQFAAASRQPRRICGQPARRDPGPLRRRPDRAARPGSSAATRSSPSMACHCPGRCRSTRRRSAEHADDPAYIAMGNLLFGTEPGGGPADRPRPRRRGARRHGRYQRGAYRSPARPRSASRPTLLSFIDLLPVLSYPFLLWAAWILHRRNARDAVSSILSLAVLMTIGAEQPSSTFLASIGVPRALNVALVRPRQHPAARPASCCFRTANCPGGWSRCSALLPVLMFLQGTIYQAVFVSFMVVAVLMLLRCMRATPSSDLRQQIRWALFGFTGYALFRALSIAGDFLKWSASSFGSQLLVEMLAGIALALAVLVLQLGPAHRPPPLPPLRRRGDHQQNREHRHRHRAARCRFRRA